jgi:hypothetical protein
LNLIYFAAKSEYISEGSDLINEGEKIETVLVGKIEGGVIKGTEIDFKAGSAVSEKIEIEARAKISVILIEIMAEIDNE